MKIDFLNALEKRCRENLFESVIPFWLDHSMDRLHGGLFSCLERDGTVYDDRKYTLPIARAVWMFSRLYNQFDHREEYLDAASLGFEFIRRFGRDASGRYFSVLTRDGRPQRYLRTQYAAAYPVLAYLEYSRATGRTEYRDEAVEMFWRMVDAIRHPQGTESPALTGRSVLNSLAEAMVLLHMAAEFTRDVQDDRIADVGRRAALQMKQHEARDRCVLTEFAAPNVEEFQGWPEARLFNPGQSIQAGWFLIHARECLAAPDLTTWALDLIEGSFDCGWDREFGGLYNLMDLEGKSTLSLDASMKLWWPQAEALHALLNAYELTREERWIEWLEKVDSYVSEHFVDTIHGEWFGCCSRRGNTSHTFKGSPTKGFFHVPRFLLNAIQLLETIRSEQTKESSITQ